MWFQLHNEDPLNRNLLDESPPSEASSLIKSSRPTNGEGSTKKKHKDKSSNSKDNRFRKLSDGATHSNDGSAGYYNYR